MSALDFTARAMALRATALTPLTFDELQQAQLPGNVVRIASSGHTDPGTGAAVYVCDSLADATLHAAHPPAVFRDAGGRYFRLAWEAQGSIAPEQFGWAEGEGNTGQLVTDAFRYQLAIGGTGVAEFTPGRTYLFSAIQNQTVGGEHVHILGRSFCPPGCRIEGKGATLKASSAGGEALVMAQGETLSTHEVIGPMAAGSAVFQLATVAEAAQFAVGDAVKWRLGGFAFDAAEPSNWGFAYVAAVDTGTGQVTLDRGLPLPWDGTGVNNRHLRRVNPVRGKVYEDLNLEGLSAAAADHVLRGARIVDGWGVQADNIRSRWAGAAMALQFCEDFHLGYVEARNHNSTGGSPAVYGRGITMAESRGRIEHLAVADCYRFGAYVEAASALTIGYFHDVVTNDSNVPAVRHRGVYANGNSRVHVERALFEGGANYLAYEDTNGSEISFGTARIVGYDAPARVPVPGYNCERLELCLNGVEELYLGAKARWIEQTIFLSDGMVAATTGAFDFAPGPVVACEVLFGGGAVQADFTDFRVGRPSLTVGLKAELVPAVATTNEISFITAYSYGSYVGGAKPLLGKGSTLWAYRSQPAQVRISTPAGGGLNGSGKYVRVRMLIVPNELTSSAVTTRTVAGENVFWPYDGQAASGALNVAIAAGATVSQTVTATGLAPGDMADASFSAALAPGLLKTVEAVANGVKVSLTNATATAIGGPAGTIHVQGRKRQLL